MLRGQAEAAATANTCLRQDLARATQELKGLTVEHAFLHRQNQVIVFEIPPFRKLYFRLTALIQQIHPFQPTGDGRILPYCSVRGCSRARSQM